MQRMWTFQEGAAKNPRIVFADGNMGYLSLHNDMYTRPDQPIGRRGGGFDVIVHMSNAAYRGGLFSNTSPEHVHIEESHRLTCIWNGLAWRSSTKTSDQPLILAAMDFGRWEANPKPVERTDK